MEIKVEREIKMNKAPRWIPDILSRPVNAFRKATGRQPFDFQVRHTAKHREVGHSDAEKDAIDSIVDEIRRPK